MKALQKRRSTTTRVMSRLPLLISLFLPLTAAAAGSDLLSVYIKALDANPDYQSAVAAFHEAVEVKPQALAKLLPQVAVIGSAADAEQAISGQYFVGSSALFPNGFDTNRRDEFYSVGYQVGLTEALYHHDLFISLDEADLKVGAAGLMIYSAQDDLRVGVAEAYFGVLAADDGLHFATAERDALKQLSDEVSNRFSSGLVTNVEVKQAQASLDLSEAALIQAQNQVQVSRAQLEQITGGQKYDQLATLSDDFRPEPPEPAKLEDWTDRARAQNLKVQAQRYETQIAQLEVNRSRSLRYPTLDALASRQYSYADGGVSRGIGANDNHELDERVQINLKIPIYSGGAVSSAIRATLAGLDKARYDETSVINNALKDTQVAFLNSSAEMSQVAAYKNALQSTQAAEEAARTGYEVGTKTYVDVLQTVRARYEAERDYAASRYTFLINTLKLKQAAGSLNHADLLAINRWLR